MSQAAQTMDNDALTMISQRTGSIKFAPSSEEAAEGHQSEAQLRHSLRSTLHDTISAAESQALATAQHCVTLNRLITECKMVSGIMGNARRMNMSCQHLGQSLVTLYLHIVTRLNRQ